MRYLRFERLLVVVALSVSFGSFTVLAQALQPRTQRQSQAQSSAQRKPAAVEITDVGTAPTEEDMGALAWVTGPSGRGLPAGSGTAKQGEVIYLAKCAMCHGPDGRGVRWLPGQFSPIGGLPLILPARPNQGAHSPWVPPITSGAPFPTVIFNTIAVEMPIFRAGTLTADEVYALTAFILAKNGLIKEDEVMNRETLPKVQMPNSKYFPPDDVYMDMNKRGCYKTHGVCVSD